MSGPKSSETTTGSERPLREETGWPWPFGWLADLAEHVTPGPIAWLASRARAGLVEVWPSLDDLLPGGRESEGADAPLGAAGGDVVRPARARTETKVDVNAGERSGRRGQSGSEDLGGALRDPSAEVAVAAAEALAGTTSPEARRELVAAVRNADGYHAPSVRRASLRALGRPRSEEERALVDAAVRDVDPDVCVAAIEILGMLRDREATDALCRLLEDGSGFYLSAPRLAAARALAHCARLAPARVRELRRRESDSAVAAALESAALDGSDR